MPPAPHASPRRALRGPVIGLVAVAALATTGCLNLTPAGTFFASQPPGAHVVVDGQDSGWITPCMIALDLEDDHAVRIELPGYAPRELRLDPNKRVLCIPWENGQTGLNPYPRFPLFLEWQSLFLPFRQNDMLAPARVFVRLEPLGDDVPVALVGTE